MKDSADTGAKRVISPQARAAGLEARRQPVAAHGWSWPSQAAAAREIGVNGATVSNCLLRGTFAALVLRRLGVKG